MDIYFFMPKSLVVICKLAVSCPSCNEPNKCFPFQVHIWHGYENVCVSSGLFELSQFRLHNLILKMPLHVELDMIIVQSTIPQDLDTLITH